MKNGLARKLDGGEPAPCDKTETGGAGKACTGGPDGASGRLLDGKSGAGSNGALGHPPVENAKAGSGNGAAIAPGVSSVARPGTGRDLFRGAASWLVALSLSLLLNYGLFSLMPLLSRSGGDSSLSPLPERAVNVIRLKRPEPPPEKKPEPPKEEKKKMERTVRQEAMGRPDALMEKMPAASRLPFELSPDLPRMPSRLPGIPLQTAAISAPAMKGAYGMGEIDNPLVPLAKGPPLYPFSARRRGIEGVVRVKFLVGKGGHVEKVEIVEAKPGKIFNASVRKCVSAWRFTPGTVGGEPVKTWVITSVRFSLEQ